MDDENDNRTNLSLNGEQSKHMDGACIKNSWFCLKKNGSHVCASFCAAWRKIAKISDNAFHSNSDLLRVCAQNIICFHHRYDIEEKVVSKKMKNINDGL